MCVCVCVCVCFRRVTHQTSACFTVAQQYLDRIVECRRIMKEAMDAVSEIHLVYAVEVKAIAHSAAEPGLSFELNIELHLARMAYSHVDCCLQYALPPPAGG